MRLSQSLLSICLLISLAPSSKGQGLMSFEYDKFNNTTRLDISEDMYSDFASSNFKQFVGEIDAIIQSNKIQVFSDSLLTDTITLRDYRSSFSLKIDEYLIDSSFSDFVTIVATSLCSYECFDSITWGRNYIGIHYQSHFTFYIDKASIDLNAASCHSYINHLLKSNRGSLGLNEYRQFTKQTLHAFAGQLVTAIEIKPDWLIKVPNQDFDTTEFNDRRYYRHNHPLEDSCGLKLDTSVQFGISLLPEFALLNNGQVNMKIKGIAPLAHPYLACAIQLPLQPVRFISTNQLFLQTNLPISLLIKDIFTQTMTQSGNILYHPEDW